MQIVDNNSGITSQLIADFLHQWYQTVMVSNCFTALTESCFKLNHDPPWKFHLKEYRSPTFSCLGRSGLEFHSGWPKSSFRSNRTNARVPRSLWLIWGTFRQQSATRKIDFELEKNGNQGAGRAKSIQPLLNTRGRMTFLATLWLSKWPGYPGIPSSKIWQPRKKKTPRRCRQTEHTTLQGANISSPFDGEMFPGGYLSVA